MIAVPNEQVALLGLLETILANSPAGFCVLDENLRYVCVNESFSRMNGYAPSQLLGSTIREETPEFALRAEAVIRRVLQLNNPVLDVEFKFIPSTNRPEVQYALASFFPMARAAGNAAWIAIMVNDVTDRKIGEQRIRESEARYRLLFDRNPYPIFFGYPRSELLGQKIEMLIPEGYCRQPDSLPGVVLMGPGLELFGLRKDGSKFPAEGSLAPLETSEGILISSAIRDATEKKQVQEKLNILSVELARSNAAMEQFASIASHDLREPMRMIASFVTLLRRKNIDKLDRDSLQYMSQISEGSKRMTELIDDLLRYSEVGGEKQEKTQVGMNAATENALANLKITIQESKAQITSAVLPTVAGDSVQLVQLLQNLIANAIKYRRFDCASEIHIDFKRRENDWLFEVRDNGIGFEMAYAQEIFNPFYRLHGNSEYRGSGLGLATCKRIVEQHGGQIWAESQIGKGSSFYFTIARNSKAAWEHDES